MKITTTETVHIQLDTQDIHDAVEQYLISKNIREFEPKLIRFSTSGDGQISASLEITRIKESQKAAQVSNN